MLLFPWALERFGIRGMLLLGLLGWCARNALFATGSLPLVVLVALPLHGLCFSFFFIVAVQYVAREAPPDLRASAQGILAVAVWGAGTLLGNWVAAVVKDRHTLGHETDWTAVWLAPFFGSVLITAVFALLFRPGRPAPPAAGPGEKELPPP
ncbi:MAG TPA: MFS transporter, partial [Gemmataceae bacterium]